MLFSKTRKELNKIGMAILNGIKKDQKKYNIQLVETLVEAGSGSSPEQKLESMALSFQSSETEQIKLQGILEGHLLLLSVIYMEIFFM